MQYKEEGCDHDDSQAASCFAHVALDKPLQLRVKLLSPFLRVRM
jgi:hypothetical protein